MREPFIKVALYNFIGMIAIFLLFLLTGIAGFNGVSIGLVVLLFSFINLFAGIIISSSSEPKSLKRQYGSSMLLMSAITLLCSFTFCTLSQFSI